MLLSLHDEYNFTKDKERNDFMDDIGSRIRELRKKSGFTQSEFVEILRNKYNLKADRVMLSKWECSKQCPQPETQ